MSYTVIHRAFSIKKRTQECTFSEQLEATIAVRIWHAFVLWLHTRWPNENCDCREAKKEDNYMVNFNISSIKSIYFFHKKLKLIHLMGDLGVTLNFILNLCPRVYKDRQHQRSQKGNQSMRVTLERSWAKLKMQTSQLLDVRVQNYGNYLNNGIVSFT